MTATYIAKELNGRRSGSGWMARCPAHRDTDPSLSLRDDNDRILVHCFAGCTQNDVIAALRKRGLWPEGERRHYTRAERREYARRRAQVEALAKRVLQWRSAMVHQWEQAKAAAYSQHLAHPSAQSEQAWADAARQLFVYENLRGATLAREYEAAMERDPAAVDRPIARARLDESHADRCTALVVAALALKAGDPR